MIMLSLQMAQSRTPVTDKIILPESLSEFALLSMAGRNKAIYQTKAYFVKYNSLGCQWMVVWEKTNSDLFCHKVGTKLTDFLCPAIGS